jgi:hypothetical protein
MLKEAITYYCNHGGSVFCVFLDATKAFDRVEYCKLFKLLINRGLPPICLRLLLNMYTNHLISIAWSNVASTAFVVQNGIKQGGILSPLLFCIYFDELLIRLKKAGLGCWIGSAFVGALAYADDLSLLAPTLGAMHSMLAICDVYAKEFNVIFNASKTKCMCLGDRFDHGCDRDYLPQFYIAGSCIDKVQEWPHLGHIISAKRSDDSDIGSKLNKFRGQANNVICSFNKCEAVVRLKLFQSYCLSFYGSVLWDLSNMSIETICTAWRIALRRIWNVPNLTHGKLLAGISLCLPLMDEFRCRFISFVIKCVDSSSDLVKLVSRNAVFNDRENSILGRNILSCCLHYGVSLYDLSLLTRRFIKRGIECERPIDVRDKILLLLEMLFVREGSHVIPGFCYYDINYIIKCICTS